MNRVDALTLAACARESTQTQTGNQSLGAVVWMAVLACTAILFSPALLRAQAGQLDAAFGTGGVFTTSAQAVVAAVALQSDGKIVVGGGGNPTFEESASLLRLNTNGSLDPTFGRGGIAKISDPFAQGGGDLVVGVAIQPDGKILAAISNRDADDLAMIIVGRFTSNGILDTSFGNAGLAVTGLQNGTIDTSVALSLQPDGKILVAGQRFMVRFNTDGQLDPTFSNGGIALIKNLAGAMLLQSNGQILIASGGFPPSIFSAVPPASNSSRGAGLISRYNPDGRLDSDFGVFGQAATVAPALGVTVQGDGTIVIAGPIIDGLLPPPQGGTTGFGLLRYNPDGSLDTGFGAHGGVLNSFGSSAPFASPNALIRQPDGLLIAAGAAGDVNSSNFALARYTADGNLDGAFGSGGQVITGIPNNRSTIVALALQSDGNIVAVGNLTTPDFPTGRMSIAVARYLGQ